MSLNGSQMSLEVTEDKKLFLIFMGERFFSQILHALDVPLFSLPYLNYTIQRKFKN